MKAIVAEDIGREAQTGCSVLRMRIGRDTRGDSAGWRSETLGERPPFHVDGFWRQARHKSTTPNTHTTTHPTPPPAAPSLSAASGRVEVVGEASALAASGDGSQTTRRVILTACTDLCPG